MSDLTAFLLARIAEDEAAAKAATPGPWSAADEHGLVPEAWPAWCVSQMRPGYESMSPEDGYVKDVADVHGDDKDACPDADHIARHDPARVLADVQAKRAIVDLSWHHFGEDEYTWGMEEAKRQILARMAVVYADHPDYRDEWRL